MLQAAATDTTGLTSFSMPVVIHFGPPNDDFANRIALGGAPVSVEGNVQFSTGEVGEPNTGTYGSVWYSWVAPQDGMVEMTVSSHFYGPALEVYQGSQLSTLSRIAGAFWYTSVDGYSAMLTMPVTAGTQYQIAIEDALGNAYWLGGAFLLNINYQ